MSIYSHLKYVVDKFKNNVRVKVEDKRVIIYLFLLSQGFW
jgi:hypothetical protein